MFAESSAKNSTPMSSSNTDQAARIVIAGGGPVGLATCLLLMEYRRRTGLHFDIHMYERRWTQDESPRTRKKIVWKSWTDNNNRREQTVTLQSNVYSLLPKHVKESLFPKGEKDDAYVEMWAMGPDSEEHNGYPRNIKIKRVEDVLLAKIQDPSSYEARLGLDPTPTKPYKAPKLHLMQGSHIPKRALQDANFVVLADGGSMSTERSLFPGVFGDRQPFPEDPNLELSETVLGIYVENENGDAIGLSEADVVLMTSSQNRFLLNPLGRKSGFLNMWLTHEEAKVAVGIDLMKYGTVQCNQSSPCSFSRCADGEFRCSSHSKVMFWPSMASRAPERDDSAGAMLWSRILDGLKLYDIKLSHVKSFTTFRLGPFKQRMCFTRDLTSCLVKGRLDLPLHLSRNRPPYAAVIGDAAFPVSFRAGRGLNTGLKAAISLSRTLTAAIGRPNGWRMADFVKHEGFMASLQMREVACRSLQMMDVQNDDLLFERVVDKIQNGIDGGDGDANKARAAVHELMNRMSVRLRGRLPIQEPDLLRLQTQLFLVSDETARVLHMSGPWNSAVVGGSELGSGEFVDEPLWSSPNALLFYNDAHLTRREGGPRAQSAKATGSPPQKIAPGILRMMPERFRNRGNKENLTTDNLPRGSFYEV